jgi:tRNA-uridine 2-sulfurtransferase
MRGVLGKTVFVGLSGGVDSSVAALRLKKQGYSVVGVFIKVWHPDFLVCNWEKERLDAMRVAAKLDIPFLTCDAEEAYRKDVAEYFIEAYKNGRTPNPDVMCNTHVKFGKFLDFALSHGADFVATGHYAQVLQREDIFELHKGIDQAKDQSYFLWNIKKDHLQHILLPVGNSQKSVIRDEAKKAGLLTAEKKDSQGICFLGHVDIAEFLSHFMTLKEGVVLDTLDETVGTHKGALIYTKGQRHGFLLHKNSYAQDPVYVIDRNIETNTITVDTQKPQQEVSSHLRLYNCNYFNYTPIVDDEIDIQTRYHQRPTKARIVETSYDTLTLIHQVQVEATSEGQSCVFYKGSRCLGGGMI